MALFAVSLNSCGESLTFCDCAKVIFPKAEWSDVEEDGDYSKKYEACKEFMGNNEDYKNLSLQEMYEKGENECR